MENKQEDYAGRVFLLMGKEYRISRSIRAQWFFQHINSIVYPKRDQELISSHEELEVLSVLPEVSHIHSTQSFRLAPSTKITFIGRQYRFIFCLDISPSEATVNAETGKMLSEEIFENFMNCIMGLVEPFTVPGSNLVLQPELVITVLAHMPLTYKTCQVLVQGLNVCQSNLYDLLYEVKSKLQTLEDILAHELIKKYEKRYSSEAELGETDDVLHDAEYSLFNMVRDALLALQLLPDNASAGLVIVTDGVFNLSDASVVDAVLAQMRSSTVVCSFLQVGNAAHNGLGYIPNTALMQFIATATSGAYMCSCPKVSTADPKQDSPPNEIQDAQPMNLYHEALLCWNFHTGADRGKIEFGNAVDELWLNKVPTIKAKKGSVLLQPMQKIKHSETKHATRIASVLSVRLREGYSIENVAITKDGTQLEVKLTLPWKEHVLIEYIAKAAWPLEQVNRSTHVDVFIEGSYDFLVDITSKQKFTSSYRKTVVYKFEQTMKSLQCTDELLVRLQLFSVNPAYTTIPDSAKDGVPLFHLPQSSKTPVLSLQHGRSKKSSKSQEALFAEYWKPILHLDTKTWQKWFHCHRVSILLENDRPISKSLFIPSSSDHFHTVHCRTAMNALNRMLRDWSSFVLLENHSYIRFLGRGGQKMPYSFCLLRLVFKGLCVVVRLAFLGGTAGTERHRMVSELKESLKSIKAPLKKPLFSPEHTLSAESPPKSVVLTTKEKHCVIFLDKPLERILVKYDSIPDDLKCVEIKAAEGEDILDTTQSSNRLAILGTSVGTNPARSNAILGALSRYMYNQRWIWKMSCHAKDLPTGAVAGVLYALTKRRLLEGFHFCSSNQNGVITMVKEIPITLKDCTSSATNNVCFLQFVLFPPHRCVQLKEGVQDESVESDAIRDNKGELQIATEIWIEPQCGVASGNEKDLKYVEGMKYYEIPGKIFSNDLQAVKEMVTYAHLESMCIDCLLTTVPTTTLSDIEPPSDCFTNSSLIEAPFLFDVVSLLSKSKQVLMLLPLLKNCENDVLVDDQCPNDILMSLFFNSMTEIVDCEVPFSAEACTAFSEFVQKRCEQTPEKESVGSHAIQFDTETDPVTWKCYAGASRRSIIILMIPASLSDVEKMKLLKTDEGLNADDENKVVESTKISEEGSVVDSQEQEPECMRENTTEASSLNKDSSNATEGNGKQEAHAKKTRPFLPIFIYECKFSTISDVKFVSPNEQNLFVDYTSKLSDSSFHADQNTQEDSDWFLDRLGRSCEFSAFCKSLSDRFFLTFVNGVFTSLQKGFVLNSKDVESSVELICEESCLEVDITSFIRIICMHFKNEKIDDEVFGHISEGNVVIRRAGKICSASTTKSTPRTPSSVKTKCGSEAIHKFVQNSFLEILQNRFTSVPQNDELFYFNANETEPIERDDHSISDADSDTEEPDLQVVNMYGSSENLPVTKEDIAETNAEREENISNLSRLSTKGSSTSLSEIESMDVLSEAASLLYNEADDASSQHPLFLHLMCTLRDRNLAGSDLALVPVNTLPTCLAEIISMLEDGGNSIDPFSPSLKVTLDLICLTLPPEMESCKMWKIVDETTSTHAASEMDEDFLFDEHGSIAEDQLKQGVFEMSDEKEIIPANQREKASTLIDNTLTDPLKTLPKAQLNAFKVIVKKIEWLLRDEIASALRSTSPVTEATLDNVAEHVKSSSASNCQFRRISLRFVSGLDKSLQLFLDELSRAEINGYHLENKGKYFYFVPNQTTISDIAAAGKSENDSQARKESKIDNLNRKDSVMKDTDRSISQEPIESQTNKAIEQETVLAQEIVPEALPNEPETKADMQGANKDSSSQCSQKQPSENVEEIEDDQSVDQGQSPDQAGSIVEQAEETQDEKEENILAICQRIILDTLDLALQNSSHETKRSDISPRSRSESLPLPLTETKQIVRRRYSDPGTSCVKMKEMSLNLDDSFVDYRGFDFLETTPPREKSDPGFWLFARVQGSEVMVFLHKRREAADSGDVQSEKCYIDLLGKIDKIGRVVNQKMLLDDLHETFTCHNLLVAEEDEQVWSRRESSPGKTLFVSSKSEMGMPFEIVKVVHGEFEFHPGFFECDKVWETFLPVHYRLKSSPGQPKGTSRAIQAVRAVLERFAVSNRSNLFVYRESSGDVFYFRIHETLSEIEPPSFTNMLRQGEDDPLKEENFSYHSAASSSWSLAGKLHQETTQEAQEETEIKEVDVRLRRTNSLLTHVEKDSVSELSFASVMSVQRIQFCVHGICEPGSEIKDELVRVLAKKLNDAVFEQLNLLIARNPKCRLAPADVQFIQPPGQSPATIIRISIPTFALPYAHSLIFYLRQNLLLRFHTPRYTEASPDFHFKDYSGHVSSFASAEPLPLNDVYLYNRREKKGYGIGCIHMTLTDCDQKPIIAYPTQQKVRTEIWEPEIYMQTLREFIDVQVANETKETQGEEEMFLEFKVWERGSIGVKEVQSFLVSDIRRALCDVFLEYFILFTPLSEIPSNLQMHYHSRASSRSSQPTTPTFVKTDPTTPVSNTPFPKQLGKKFLSEPATPAEVRARSPATILRKRSLIELPVKEFLSRKSSKESPKEAPKKTHQDTVENIEKTYETLEEFFPLNPTENQSRESPVPKRSDSEEASRKESFSNSSGVHSGSVSDVERMLPKLSGMENSLGSPYDTLTDREVEESFNATNEPDDRGKDKKEPTWKEVELRRRRDREARMARRRYERGEIGFLHPCYCDSIDVVLKEIMEEGSYSVHKHNGSLDFKYASELVLKEVLKILVDIAPNIKPKVFKESTACLLLESEESEAVVYSPYYFERSAVRSDDISETSTDVSSLFHPASILPGFKSSFIAVGRNMKQWRQCVSLNEAVSDEEEKTTSNTGFSKQHFKPLMPENATNYSASRSADAIAPSCIKMAFVPRQKFYLIRFMDKEIVTYTYNFPIEVNVLLDKQLSRLYGWHNARMHLASCLSIQKLGLFHHLHFTEDKQCNEETASFCSSTTHSHVTGLLKETAPPPREKNKAATSDLSKSLGLQMPTLDETFRNTAPSLPLSKASYRHSNDPIKRIGYQYQEITRTKINVASQQAKLKEILETWHNLGAHYPLFENRLSLLKRHSRFIHFCQTPLLFNPSSSTAKESKTDPKAAEKIQEQNDKSSTESKQNGKEETSVFVEEKHDWYGELKWVVMQKYMQYLQTLGFCVVQLQPNAKGQQTKSSKGSLKRSSSKSLAEATTRSRPSVHYLQKSTNAGILLIELSYRNDNLFLKMFAFDASRVKSLERYVTMHEHWMFQDDCNKYKDLLHLHSFAYDLQLRQAQQFLSGRNMIFYPGYPVQKLFERMMSVFPKPPAFSCCYLAQGTVSIPCTAELDTKEVYKYLSINAERYKMDPAKITKIDDSGMDQSLDQSILSYMYYTSKSQDKGEFQKLTSGFRRDSADFDGNVIITLSPSQDKEVLNLTFFLILTNRREFYPRRSLKSQMSSLRSRRKRTFSGSEKSSTVSDDNQQTGPHKLRVRFSTDNSSNSLTEDSEKMQTGPLKVPTWPGTLNPTDSSSPTHLSSPSSDTVLLIAKKNANYTNFDASRLSQSPSAEMFIRRSSSNDSISSSVLTSANIRKSSSYGQLSESTEVADVNFLANEVAFVSGRLSKIACTCLSNCWRDFMWYQLLIMENSEDEGSAKKQKKKVEVRKESIQDVVSQNWKLTETLRKIRKVIIPSISVSEVKLLLELVKVYPISMIDKRMETIYTLLGNTRGQKHGTMRVLSGKFGKAYREFTTDDARTRYICLLNPRDLDMFVMVTTDTDGMIRDIKAVYREEPRFQPSNISRFGILKETDRADVEHIESVMSCLSYNIWTQLLPSQ